jgi:glucose-1-phosphatase
MSEPVRSEPVRALLFDLGNVFIRVRMQRAFAYWARAAGADAQLLARRYAHGPAYAQHEVGALSGAQYFAALRTMLGIDLDDAAFEAGWNDVFDGIETEVHAAIVAAARVLPVYAFSNTNRTHKRHFMQRYAAEMAVFQQIFDSSEIGLRKPERAAFEHVVARIGAPARTILFFDDLPENIAGAVQVGLQTVLVRGPDDTLSALALQRTVDSPR